MSQYTSTREGFQVYMKSSLTGPAEKAKEYVEATATPSFYIVLNGQRKEYDAYLEMIAEMRAKITDYEPVVQEFLRDGDQLAARMTGTLKLDGAETAFESFIFATVDRETGKVASLIERGVYGPVGGVPEHGIK